MATRQWHVAHTKPRCEKSLAEYCDRRGIPATLPCYSSVHRYPRKTVVFRKPLFPGYVFLELVPEQAQLLCQSRHVARLLTVFDQQTFQRQLQDILLALESRLGVRLAPALGDGMRVRIKTGPLRGVEGWIERRLGPNTVFLRLDFINQAAAVNLGADQLEPI